MVREFTTRPAAGAPPEEVNVLDETLRDVFGALRFFGRIDLAGENDRVVNGLGNNIRGGHRHSKNPLQFTNVAADADLQCGDLVAGFIHRENGRLAIIETDDIEFAGRAHDCIRNLRITNENFGRVFRKIDNH